MTTKLHQNKKLKIATPLIATLIIGLVISSPGTLTTNAFAKIPQASFTTGNGAPSGPHFSLNIIGVSNTKNFPITNQSGGNVIFVPYKDTVRSTLHKVQISLS